MRLLCREAAALNAVISSEICGSAAASARWEIPVQPLQSGAARGERVCDIWFPAQDVRSQQGGRLPPIREIKQDRGQSATPISTRGHWTAARPGTLIIILILSPGARACTEGLSWYRISRERKHIKTKRELLFKCVCLIDRSEEEICRAFKQEPYHKIFFTSPRSADKTSWWITHTSPESHYWRINSQVEVSSTTKHQVINLNLN